MKRTFLTEQLGLDKDIVNQIMAEHGKTLQSHIEANEDLQKQLDEAQTIIQQTSESNQTLEQIQKDLDDYKTKYEQAESTLSEERKTHQIKEAITKHGGKDLEYLMFKLGDLEDISELDSKVEELKSSMPEHFQSDSKETEMEIIGTELDKGQSAKTFTIEEINNMTTEEINANWDVISKGLEQ